MDIKQEYCEIYEHDIKTEAVLINCQTLSIQTEKFKNDDQVELGNMVSIFKSQVTEKLISVDEFKQECEVPKIEQRSEFPLKIDPDLVADAEYEQMFSTNIENTTEVKVADISDIKQEVCEYESELLTSHCDLPTLKSENNDNPNYLMQSCSNIEEIYKNCSKDHPLEHSCIVCQKDYLSAQSGFNQGYEEHFKKYLCLKQASDIQELSNHVKICSNEKQFKCDICSKQFDWKSNLKQHLIIHSNSKAFESDIGSKEFIHKANLIHTNVKMFKCDICYKEFKRKFNLQQHLIIHSKKKPFKCDICSQKFNQKTNLKQHLAIHSNERPLFKCDICSKKLKRERNLQVHLLIHSNEKQFKCDICSQKFYEKSNLKQHLAYHSNEKLLF